MTLEDNLNSVTINFDDQPWCYYNVIVFRAKGKWHHDNGPAGIWSTGSCEYWLKNDCIRGNYAPSDALEE